MTTGNDPRGRQAGFNALSRDQWVGFAGHRDKVSSRLGAGSSAGPRGRLCVLGAGNGNDLDLPALLDAYEEVHLVDIDAEALAQGASRQGVAGHPGLRVFGGVDLTGMVDVFATWTPQTPVEPAALAALAEAPSRLVVPALEGPFDVVASTCLLTQLIGNAFHSLGERHPQFLDAVRAIRAGHLRLMARLTARGGAAVLVTDVVSSDTLPALATLPEPVPPGLLAALARDGNYFHGVNPAALPRLFLEDPVLGTLVASLEMFPPWRWNLHERIYLVWALRFRVVASGSGSGGCRQPPPAR